MNNNSLIRYCRFHYPPSNANSQEAESELHKSDKTVEQSHSKSDNEVFGRCSRYHCMSFAHVPVTCFQETTQVLPQVSLMDSLQIHKHVSFTWFHFQKQQEQKGWNMKETIISSHLEMQSLKESPTGTEHRSSIHS